MDGSNHQDRPIGKGGQPEQETDFPHATTSTVKTWSPARFLSGQAPDIQSENPYAVIILNQPLDNKDLLVKVCQGGTPPPAQLPPPRS